MTTSHGKVVKVAARSAWDRLVRITAWFVILGLSVAVWAALIALIKAVS